MKIRNKKGKLLQWPTVTSTVATLSDYLDLSFSHITCLDIDIQCWWTRLLHFCWPSSPLTTSNISTFPAAITNPSNVSYHFLKLSAVGTSSTIVANFPISLLISPLPLPPVITLSFFSNARFISPHHPSYSEPILFAPSQPTIPVFTLWGASSKRVTTSSYRNILSCPLNHLFPSSQPPSTPFLPSNKEDCDMKVWLTNIK